MKFFEIFLILCVFLIPNRPATLCSELPLKTHVKTRENPIIFLFGASCSGKSTLGKALQHYLGEPWVYIDRDDLIDSGLCTDSTADSLLEEKIQSLNHPIIIDAQIPWRQKKEGEFYFMILPPLEVLLARDALRTQRLERSEKRAYYARDYVITTYVALSNMDINHFDGWFDSSQISVEEEIDTVQSLLEYGACRICPIETISSLTVLP